ncbi:hypothetical protein BDZ45DRAFT_673303 [Acephala macrosclerotiorum]|nr:hypothetical protein BDZ45DRAFT_673303 [Acephala macrosclerotiorum]
MRQQVEDFYLKRIPKEVKPEWYITNVQPKSYKHGGDRFDLWEFYINILDVSICKPKASKPVDLAKGISYDNNLSVCEITVKLATKQRIATVKGMEASSPISGSTEFSIFSIETSFTQETSWEETWETESSQDNEYKFELKPGQSCVPVFQTFTTTLMLH